ncbi:MAG: RNA-binding domain-containing protein [Candidatus Bathyarchaeia archaeon]|nr:exosome protein [Candidatus Bathyarchaeota archaeon]
MIRHKIAYINLSFFAHATEDQEKVLLAAKNIFPAEYAEKIAFSKSTLKGEYGNPIIFFKTEIRDSEIAESLLHNISINLPVIDKEDLLQHLNLHLSGGNLYIRLNKQEAFKGKIRLCRADPIRLQIRFKTSRAEEIREICRLMGLLP